MNANANERKINCCSCGARTADYYFTAEPMGCGGIENWCFRCEEDLRENETDKLVRNIEQVYICQGCNCDIQDNGFCSEGCTHGQDEDEDEGSTTNEEDEDEEKTCECCGEFHDVGLATGENGIEMLVCKYCDIDGSNYNGWGDETEYMNELIECFTCEKDVKRKNMAWEMGGGYYLDVCQKCYEDKGDKIKQSILNEMKEDLICEYCDNVIKKHEHSFEYEWIFDITSHIHLCKKCVDTDELDLTEYNLCSLSEEEKNAKDIFSRILIRKK